MVSGKTIFFNYKFTKIKVNVKFSPHLAKYCGSEQFPRPVVSTTGAMWLRFYSDKLIERKGFKAIISFVPAQDPDSVNIRKWK